jgi:hypothetical protein
MSDNFPTHRPKVTVQEAPVIVASGSKLAALRDRVRTTPVSFAVAPAPSVNARLNQAAASELRKAQALIDQRCAQIMASYPQGRQQKMFSLRFGPLDALRKLPVNMIFKRLDINPQAINLRLLAKTDYFGDSTD